MHALFSNKNQPLEPVWHVQTTMLAAIVLQLLLPDRFFLGSRYLLITIEVLLLVAMSFTTPKERIFQSLSRRINVFLLITLTGVVNGYGLVEVTRRLLQ